MPTNGMGEIEQDPNNPLIMRISPLALGDAEFECCDALKHTQFDQFIVRVIDRYPSRHHDGRMYAEEFLDYDQVQALVAYAQKWLDTHDPKLPQVSIRQEEV